MNPEEMEHAINVIAAWTDEAADTLNRIIDRIHIIETKIDNLNARINEWDIKP